MMAKKKKAKKKKPKKNKDKKKRLKPAEKLFCKLYAGNTHCFNKAVKAYATAYKYDLEGKQKKGMTSFEKEEYKKKRKNVASVLASRLLRKVKILEECEKVLLKDHTHALADSQLVRLMRQDDSFATKLNAIMHYNKKEGRIVDRFVGTTMQVKKELTEKEKKKWLEILYKNK